LGELKSFAYEEEYFEIKLTETIQKITIEVRLSYQPRPGDIYPIHREIREVVP